MHHLRRPLLSCPVSDLHGLLPLCQLAADQSSLLVNTLWGSSVAVTAVDLSGKVTRLSPPATSLSVLTTSSARVYAAGSSLAAVPSAFALDLPTMGGASSGEGSVSDAVQTLGPEVQSKWQAAGDVLAGLRLPDKAQALLQDISVTRRVSGKLDKGPPCCTALLMHVCSRGQNLNRELVSSQLALCDTACV